MSPAENERRGGIDCGGGLRTRRKRSLSTEDQTPSQQTNDSLASSDGSSSDEEDSADKWQESDWEWPAYDEYYNQHGHVLERRRRKAEKSTDDEKKPPFQVVYRLMKDIPRPELVVVEVDSFELRKVLYKLWPENEKLLLLDHTDNIKAKDLYLKLEELKGMLDPKVAKSGPKLAEADEKMSDPGPNSAEVDAKMTEAGSNPAEVDTKMAEAGPKPAEAAPKPTEIGADELASDSKENTAQVQLRHLIRFVEIEYANATKQHERVKITKRVPFDMLWTFLAPGERVVYKSCWTDEQVCGKVRKAVYKFNNDRPSRMCLSMKLDVYEFDCDSFSKVSVPCEIVIYSHEKPFSELSVYPFGMTEESAESLEDRFLAQGARYGYLTTATNFRYMQFKGPMYERTRNGFGKENADGRVMVDLFSFSKIMGENAMGCAVFPSRVTGEGIITTVDISEDPNRIFAPGVVYGFSFRLKRWGCFSIHGFSEIFFDGGSSWNQLVMDPVLKEVTEHLVSEHLKKSTVGAESGIDPIANKGEGCVIICYGPPGTGKTLTAESMAEKLHAPLWSLSVSELGLTPDALEEKLVTILEVANSWNTILLLDEADVYLEKRTISSDLTRNAMTGLFLRHLEYYKGVLLLTTNRILTFDDAFRSRISVFLRYPKLTTEQRQVIWINMLKRAKLEGDAKVMQELAHELAGQELNGREIRNAIQNAQTLARAVKEPLTSKHVINATRVLASSLASLMED